MSYYPIHDAPNFDADATAERIDRALREGKKDDVTKILVAISNKQRQRVKEPYRLRYGKELSDALAKKFGGAEGGLVEALVDTPLEYDVKSLKKATKGIGTDENVLIEIICSRTPEQLTAIRRAYEKKYGVSLEKDVEGDTSGEFRDVLVALVTGAKDGSDRTNDAQAKDDAVRLFADGKANFKGGKDGSHFLKILATQNQYQLRKVFREFEALSGASIEKAIEKEFKGDLAKSYLAIVRSSSDKQRYFATQLEASMKGLGTREADLTRVIVARSEVDLNLVKDYYKELYNKSLEDAVKGEVSGVYRDTLLAIIGGNRLV